MEISGKVVCPHTCELHTSWELWIPPQCDEHITMYWSPTVVCYVGLLGTFEVDSSYNVSPATINHFVFVFHFTSFIPYGKEDATCCLWLLPFFVVYALFLVFDALYRFIIMPDNVHNATGLLGSLLLCPTRWCIESFITHFGYENSSMPANAVGISLEEPAAGLGCHTLTLMLWGSCRMQLNLCLNTEINRIVNLLRFCTVLGTFSG